jgi:hypothetical protein
MEWSPADILDRMSIVQLKIERIGLSESEKELEVLKESLKQFKEKGIEIKDEWLDELYEINRKEWDLLGEMNQERKKEMKDYAKIGELYIRTEEMNKKRAEAKNKIIEETGVGFKEIKKNHPSE